MENNNPTLYIIAGANGSGKTTFAKQFSAQKKLYFINADEIAKSLDAKNITKYKVKAGKIFFKELKLNLQLKKTFIIETTLSGNYLVKYIEQAKKLNFKTSLIYLFLEEPSINIERVNNRVLNGGHYVPKEDIIRRFYRSQKLFFKLYKNLVCSWCIYYNSDDTFEKVANNNNIFDTEKYNTFKKGIKCK